MYKIILTLFVSLILHGCAIGNKYDYQSTSIALPVKGTGDVGLSVIDNREYVLSGEKKPNFIGLQRGGFNNPFDVTTASGESLTYEISSALHNALISAGFNASRFDISTSDSTVVATALAQNGYKRNIVLTVNEWKTDVYMNITLHFDLLLQIMSPEGSVLATNSLEGKERIGGAGLQGQNSKSAASALETKIGRLFNTPEVITALSN